MVEGKIVPMTIHCCSGSHLLVLQKAGSLTDPCWRPPPQKPQPAPPTENGVHLLGHTEDLFCNPKFRFGIPSAKFLLFDGPGGSSTAKGELTRGVNDDVLRW